MRNRTLNLAGWLLFVVSACAFIVSSYRNGDGVALAGGVFFLAACLVFLIPYFRRDAD